MEAVWIPIIVALIGGPLMWLLARFDRRNTEQHGANMAVLHRVESKVDHVQEVLTDHIVYHLDNETTSKDPR